MKLRLLLTLLIPLLCHSVRSQDFEFSKSNISATDSLFLANVPQLELPDEYKTAGKELPYSLDNSEHVFFRSIFSQFNYSCGQASSIGYNFTYEINRIRNLAGNTDTTQYTPSFTYNYFTHGINQVGVNYYYTFDAIKHAGNPCVQDFGGMGDDLVKWMDGYEKYHRAMYNRTDEISAIYVGDEEGLVCLKYWLLDHLDGTEPGGLANFYTDQYSYTSLPPGTPEAGKSVITYFGPYSGHSMTIIGWNDSIRYDYNEDSLYTNDIDINNDGTINLKDWEIGGVEIANSHGEDWADSGFCYVMYKVLAEEKADGGIWNKSVNVFKLKEEYEPLLTYKITLKHDSRNKIKIIAGVSSDVSDLQPEETMEFPIFNYQGGNNFMQGYNSDESFKTLELGLDVSPLLSHINNGEPARFFLQVREHDPENKGTGDLIAFSLMDYSEGGENEISCPQTPLPLIENGVTTVSVTHLLSIDKVGIETEDIPPFIPGETYSIQIDAEGGLEPYNWEIAMDYFENQKEESYPDVQGEQLVPTGSDHGYAIKPIGFPFPFYGKTYDTIVVHTDGFIMFRETNLPLPYQVEDVVLFEYEPMLAPFLKKELLIASPEDKILYEGNEGYAAFRWKENIVTDDGMLPVDFTAVLFPDGTVNYHYSNPPSSEDINWISGISKGDGENYQIAGFSSLLPAKDNQKTTFIPNDYISQINIDNEGLITAYPEIETRIYNLNVRVTDNNEISSTRGFQVSSGLIFDYSIISGGDENVEYGETAYVSFEITNPTSQAITEVVLSGNTPNDFANLIDDTEVIGDIAPGETLYFENALSIQVSEFVPDRHSIITHLTFGTATLDWKASMDFTAYSPIIEPGNLIIDDGGNNKLDPGDTVYIIIPVTNLGHAPIDSLTGIFETQDPYISFLSSGNLDYGTVLKGEMKFDTVRVLVDENAPDGYMVVFSLGINAPPLVQIEELYELPIGRFSVLIIDLDPDSVSSPIIKPILDELEVTYHYSNIFTNNEDDYHNLFVFLGRKNHNHILSLYEGQKLAAYLNSGGNLFMEGGMTWIDELQTDVHPLFHTGVEIVDWQLLDSVFGVSQTFTDGMQFGYSGGLPVYDNYFVPESPAYSVFHGQGPDRVFMVAYDNGDYKTVGSNIDFEGLEDNNYPSTKKRVLAGILDFFGIEGLITSVNETSDNKGNLGFSCFPNPSSGETNFVFELDKPGIVNLEIISIAGKEKLSVVLDKAFPKGQNRVIWNGSGPSGNHLPPGIYVCRLSTPEKSSLIKFVVME